jgi:hypothetical protein
VKRQKVAAVAKRPKSYLDVERARGGPEDVERARGPEDVERAPEDVVRVPREGWISRRDFKSD